MPMMPDWYPLSRFFSCRHYHFIGDDFIYDKYYDEAPIFVVQKQVF